MMLYVFIAIFLLLLVRDYIKDRKIEKELAEIKRECLKRSDNNAE